MVMSSSPPEYQTLSQHDPDEAYSSSTSKPVYPPSGEVEPENAGEGSGMPRDDGGELITVTYTFVPRYPVKGAKQNALGVLYSDKLRTAAAVRRIFHSLQEYELDRIEILAPVWVDRETKWGVVMDEAWPRMISEVRPKRLKVQVADGPGDAEARKEHRIQLAAMWSFVSLVIILGLMMFIAAIVRAVKH